LPDVDIYISALLNPMAAVWRRLQALYNGNLSGSRIGGRTGCRSMCTKLCESTCGRV